MKQPRLLSAFFCLGILCLSPAAFATDLTKVSGIVQVQGTDATGWVVVKNVPLPLAKGDTVRTGFKAAATIVFDDGSRVELGGNANFTLEETQPHRSGMSLNAGTLRAYVKKLASRAFQVKTPTAVCSVRGTEFKVEVLGGGRTIVDLYKGLLGVEDHRGQQVLLHPNERLEIDLRGMGETNTQPTQTQINKSEFHSVMRREMSLDMSKEDVQAAAAREIKLAEFQQGKVLMDVFGQRIRLEEYIMRPAPDQFKLVVLNERAARFDYFYYLGTFNQALPADLTVALRQLSGGFGTAPDYFLTSFESGRSNTRDSVVEVGQGGHLVDVNNNNDNNDNVAFFYDSATDKFLDAAGQPVFQTIFDRYGFYINGGLKSGWTGNNLQTYADKVASATTDPISGANLAVALPNDGGFSRTIPDANNIHEVLYQSYSDGTFIQFDNYIFSDDGRIATVSDFENGGVSYKQKILNFNYEQVITATEFGGRKIDLVVEPKILVQSGLIQ